MGKQTCRLGVLIELQMTSAPCLLAATFHKFVAAVETTLMVQVHLLKLWWSLPDSPWQSLHICLGTKSIDRIDIVDKHS